MSKVAKKNILLVGSSAAEYALAAKFSSYDMVDKVFAAPGNKMIAEYAECVDIREDSPQELLEFALKNDIYLTVASSVKAIKADIGGFFQANGQLIFAPSASGAQFATGRASGKKFMYRLHIPTPKFGVFEKEQLALDYIKNSPMPVVIGPDEVNENSVQAACTTVNLAKTCISDLFLRNEQRVVIEEFSGGTEFTLYVITDGYHVLPLLPVRDYKFLEDGNAGLLTCGMGAFAPDYKVSDFVVNCVMNNVRNMLSSLEKRQNPYLGILGIDCVLTGEDRFVTLGFTPFLKDHHAPLVLDLLDENLFTLFEACAVGSFADDYEGINLNGLSGISAVLYSRAAGNIITGTELLEDETDLTPFNISKNEYLEYVTIKGRNLILTRTASTLTRAKELLYDDIDSVNFDGKKFRSDICN